MSRTIVTALEDAAAQAEPWRGFHFVGEEGAAEPFFSYAGAERASARYGGSLQSLGLRKGDRVALVLPEGDDFVFTLLGAMRAGLVPVPMYPPLGLGQLGGWLEGARHVVAKSGARALVTSPKIARMLGTVEASCPALKQIVTIDALRSSREALRPIKITLDDVALIQFTSGSTSRPKGVVLTHANVAANVEAINHAALGLGKDDVGVSWLPLYHDMGLIGFVLAPLYDRIPIVLLSPMTFLKRPVAWLRALSRHRGTISYAPNFAYALAQKRVRPADLEGLDLSAWRVAGCGAEPVRKATLDAFAKMLAPAKFSPKAFVASYGMAEATLAISFEAAGNGVREDVVHGPALWQEGVARPVSPDHPEAVSLTRCGHALPEHEVQIFALDDETSDKPLPERAVGELRVRGPSIMLGYHDDRELTAGAFAGGWFRTGDLGYLAGGEIVPCGRAKELVIVNGRNFYPADLEHFASQVPGVRKGNVVAFGTQSPEGDRERVVVVLESTATHPDERAQKTSEVRQRIQEGLGLTVDDVVAVDAGVLPKTSSGKLQRLATRKLYVAGELLGRKSAREGDRVDWAKELLRSQLAFAIGRVVRR